MMGGFITILFFQPIKADVFAEMDEHGNQHNEADFAMKASDGGMAECS